MRIRLSGQEIYQRRIRRGLAKGHSRSVARGHGKAGEPMASGLPVKRDDRLKTGFARVASGESLTGVARSVGVSRERLRRDIAERGAYVRHGKRYAFVPTVVNNFPLYSDGRLIRVFVDDENASRLGEFMAAVRQALATGQPNRLDPYVSEGVTDVRGKFHPFETDLETLYELRAKGRPQFHELYRNVNTGT